MANSTGHGGPRPGSGRKPAAETARLNVGIRLSPAELAEIKRRAAQRGLPYNEYIRRAALPHEDCTTCEYFESCRHKNPLSEICMKYV